MITFSNDDPGYLAWIEAHKNGFVLNVRRVADPDYVILHRADCFTIANRRHAPGAFTGKNYRKICAADVDELMSFISPPKTRGVVTARSRSGAVAADRERMTLAHWRIGSGFTPTDFARADALLHATARPRPNPYRRKPEQASTGRGRCRLRRRASCGRRALRQKTGDHLRHRGEVDRIHLVDHLDRQLREQCGHGDTLIDLA